MGNRRPLIFFLLLALFASACTNAADQAAEEVVPPTSTTTTTTSTTTTSAPPEPEFAGTSIIVGIPPDTPGVQDIIALTPEFFTGPTGIGVDFRVLPEQELRERAAATGTAGMRFSVFAFDNFIVPLVGPLDWFADLAPFAEADPNYDIDDLIPSVRSSVSVDGQLFGAPFYCLLYTSPSPRDS